MNLLTRNDLAYKLLAQHTPAYDLVLGVLGVGGDTSVLVDAFQDEDLARREGSSPYTSFEEVAGEAAAALLRGEPFEALVGRVLRWNLNLHMSATKLINLVIQVERDLE